MANEFKKYDLVFLKPGIYTENPYNPLNVIGWHGGPDSRTVYWENRASNTYSPEELILPTDEEIAKYFRKKYPEGCIVAFNDGDSFTVEYNHPIRVRRENDNIFVDYYGSASYLYSNGKFATVIKKAEDKSRHKTREQLLEMFPPGTEFIPYRHNDPCHKVTVDESWVLYSSGSGAHWFKDTQGNSAHRGYVQDYDQLATIVKKAQNVKKAQKSEDVIAELQIKFPVGTVFKPVEANGRIHKDAYTVKDTWLINKNSTGYYYGSTASTHFGYIKLHSGEEAKIIRNTSVENNTIDEFSISPLEYVQANFPPGTVFIPEEGTREEVIVQKDWTLNIGSRGSIWFRDELRSSVHDGFLYLARTETYAKIVSPGTVPQLENESAQVFAAIDRPVIVSKTAPTTGPNVPVIVSIPTLLKTKKKSKLISNQ
jgi:hypothetical protein